MEQIIVTKQDLLVLQQRGFLKNSAEVEAVWTELRTRCPLLSDTNRNTNDINRILNIPPLQRTLKPKQNNYDICITYSPKNGAVRARQIKELLESMHQLKVTLVNNDEDTTDWKMVESRIAQSLSLVVLLTEKCLQEVHDASTCLFPGYDEQPPCVVDIFSEKAITFLSCYAEIGVEQIAQKYESEMKVLQTSEERSPSAVFSQLLVASNEREQLSLSQFKTILGNYITDGSEVEALSADLDRNSDGLVDVGEFSEMMVKSPKFASLFASSDKVGEENISTRLFLSHKRSTGQGIAGRLYEGLKHHYKVFLDSEAKSHFIFILTPGIFLSKWCLEELKSATAHNKMITVVRELSYTLPDILPEEWRPFESLLRSEDQLIWLAEYNQACIDAIATKTGPPDEHLQVTKKHFPAVLAQLERTGVLDMQTNPIYASSFFYLTKDNRDLWNKIKTVQSGLYSFSKHDALWLKDVKLPNVEFVRGNDANMKPLLSCLNSDKISELTNYDITPTKKLPSVEKLSLSSDSLEDVTNLCGPNLKSVIIASRKFNYSKELADEFVKKFQYLEEFGLSSRSVLKEFPVVFPSVTRVDFSIVVKEATLEIIAKCFPNVTSIRLVQKDFSETRFSTCRKVVLPAVHSVELELGPFHEDDIVSISECFPNVRSLSLSSGYAHPDENMFASLVKCNQLRVLKMREFGASAKQTEYLLPIAAQLEHLEATNLPASFLPAIAQQSQALLKHLEVNEWPYENLSHLTSVGFSNLEFIAPIYGIPELVEGLLQLKKLRTVKISTETFSLLLPLLPQLHSLTVIDPCFEDGVLEQIIELGTNLKYLEIEAALSGGITLAEVCKRMPQVERFKVQIS